MKRSLKGQKMEERGKYIGVGKKDLHELASQLENGELTEKELSQAATILRKVGDVLEDLLEWKELATWEIQQLNMKLKRKVR